MTERRDLAGPHDPLDFVWDAGPVAFVWDVREVDLSDDDFDGQHWSAVAVNADGATGRLTITEQDGSKHDIAFRRGNFDIPGGSAIYLHAPDHPNHGWFIWPSGQNPELGARRKAKKVRKWNRYARRLSGAAPIRWARS